MEGSHQRPPGTEILGGRECKSKSLPWGGYGTANYMYIVVQVYFSHVPVIFAGDLAAVHISEVSIIA